MSVSSPSNTSNTAADQAADKPMTRPDNAHSTGVADSGRWSTKRIAMYALFVALSMAVSFIEFPIIQACSGSNTTHPASSASSRASRSDRPQPSSSACSASCRTCSPTHGAP